MQQMNLLGRVLKYIQSTELPIKMFYGRSANWETNENKKHFMLLPGQSMFWN